MNKQLIISFDDIRESCDRWEAFEKLFQEFPEIKVTFFVITEKSESEFFKKIKTKNTELVFHSFEHSGHWLDWTVEKAKEWLLKYQNFGFEKGFKAPGWRLTDNIRIACKELGFWLCSSPTIPVNTKQYWYTYPQEGFREYDNYVEFYDHVEHQHYDGKQWIKDENVFFENLEKLKQYCRQNKIDFKFITEVLKTNE